MKNSVRIAYQHNFENLHLVAVSSLAGHILFYHHEKEQGNELFPLCLDLLNSKPTPLVTSPAFILCTVCPPTACPFFMFMEEILQCPSLHRGVFPVAVKPSALAPSTLCSCKNSFPTLGRGALFLFKILPFAWTALSFVYITPYLQEAHFKSSRPPCAFPYHANSCKLYFSNSF